MVAPADDVDTDGVAVRAIQGRIERSSLPRIRLRGRPISIPDARRVLGPRDDPRRPHRSGFAIIEAGAHASGLASPEMKKELAYAVVRDAVRRVPSALRAAN